jgi:hypothetical protein
MTMVFTRLSSTETTTPIPMIRPNSLDDLPAPTPEQFAELFDGRALLTQTLPFENEIPVAMLAEEWLVFGHDLAARECLKHVINGDPAISLFGFHDPP